MGLKSQEDSKTFSENDVFDAYLKLKNDIYFDQVNLFLRRQIAEFECEDEENFKKEIRDLTSFLNSDTEEDEYLKKRIPKIDYRFLPKSLEPDNKNQDCFITNDRKRDGGYNIEKVNYFISMPVELHIIDVLWSLKVGAKLDKLLCEECLGNRVNTVNNVNENGNKNTLFKFYLPQYSKWRSNAIEKALKSLDNGEDVLIVGLDIKEFFYNVRIDWEKFEKDLLDHEVLLDYDEKKLTKIVEKIHGSFREKIGSNLKITHEIKDSNLGVPIGLSSSRILANWFLDDLDKNIKKKINPIYYGRYVDDIIVVIANPSKHQCKDKNSAIRSIFCDCVLKEEKEGYSVVGKENLKIQEKKILVHYYDAEHSHAGLKEFSRIIAEQASEFRFLPTGDDEKFLDECAYDVQYRGSVNKLRSVIGLHENDSELSKFLSRRIIQFHLSKDYGAEENIKQLFRFYKGSNIFDFLRLWEKVFSLLITTDNKSKTKKFFKNIRETIKKCAFKEAEIIEHIKKDMFDYLEISLSVALGLKSKSERESISEEISIDSKMSDNFRESNLIRHNLVCYPLLNYTEYNGDLTCSDKNKLQKITNWNTELKEDRSPRKIHLDERQVFRIIKDLYSDQNKNEDIKIWNDLGKLHEYEKEWIEIIPKYKKIQEYEKIEEVIVDKYKFKENEDKKDAKNKKKIIGLVNIKVELSDIRAAYQPNKNCNLSYKRQADLYNLLNESIRDLDKKCDLVVFPEFSIPIQWLSPMVRFARKSGVALVFGLEHVVAKGKASNIVITALPYNCENNEKRCLVVPRLKNHYAPKETKGLQNYKIAPNEPFPYLYHVFDWNGMCFSVFNCFELTDIKHRSLMRAEVDILATIAWNPDTNYYDNIICSSSRDLQAYIIHSNTSEFGGSKIIAPKKEEEKEYVAIKGGLSPVLIKTEIDIEEIRDFQIRSYDSEDKRFKPLPAGYESVEVKKRILGEE